MSRHVVPTRRPKYINGDFTTIIIGSKPNYKMRSFGPLSLLKIDGIPLIEKQIKEIRKATLDTEIILVTGFETDRIIRKVPYGVRVIENCRYNETNECEDIRLALNATLHQMVLIIHCNLIFDKNIIKEISNKQSCIVVNSDGKISPYEIGVTSIDDKPTILSYGIDNPKWCKVTSFIGKEFSMLKSMCNRQNSKKLLVEILNEMLNKEHRFKTVNPSGVKVSFLGTSKELK